MEPAHPLSPSRRWLPRSYSRRHGAAWRVELAAERRMRTRNTLHYRIAHWPLWVWVFFIAPGPLTAALFAGEASGRTMAWLGAVLVGTSIAALRGKLPGTEPAPYILRFGHDLPNPVYRRVCYTLGWSVILSFAAINLIGLIDAVVSGAWRIREIYTVWYFPLAGSIWTLGALGRLPRARPSTKYEGIDRRYFYGAVWAVATSQLVLLVLWKALAVTPATDVIKLAVYGGVLGAIALLARYGLLPRTRPILSGELSSD
jgi:hypothetical protein